MRVARVTARSEGAREFGCVVWLVRALGVCARVARTGAWAAVLLGASLPASEASAQPVALPATAQRLEGFGPDGQIAGGVGFGLGRELPNAFLGRARLGLLYVHEPWFANAGVTIEVGGIAEVGIGGELEWNEFDGVYANLGLARLEGDRLIGHLAAGYTIFGLEWQHGFGSVRPSDALLFQVRLPLGFWWFSFGRKERSRPPPAATKPERPRVRARPPTAAAEPLQPTAAAGDPAPRVVPDPEELRRELERQLEQGELVAAAETLRRYVAAETASPARRADAEARLAALQARLPRLRLRLEPARGDEQIQIDGALEPSLLLGYDLALDPGEHQLRVLRGARVLHEQRLVAREGELLRLTIPLEPAHSR